jgi:AhpD family alkylhydroperoxidase
VKLVSVILHRINSEIGKSFDELCSIIDKTCGLDPKVKELIRLACVVMDRSKYGIQLHAANALRNGASKNELIGTVCNCLPVSGIEAVANGLIEVLFVIDQAKEENYYEQ